MRMTQDGQSRPACKGMRVTTAALYLQRSNQTRRNRVRQLPEADGDQARASALGG
jgi:hypothetical protein